jgi:SAM-dependent methyltransferase
MEGTKHERKEFTLRDVLKDLLERPDAKKDHELEVRFRTTSKTKLSKIDFDNVIRKLKSMHYSSPNPQGEYQLKIQTEFTDVKTGRTKMSNMRTQITGLSGIQEYCKKNSFSETDPSVFHMMKTYAKINDHTVFPINNDDYQFRISYQKESKMSNKSPLIKQLVTDWTNTKKNFRYINRVSFQHYDQPIRFDLSVVKSSINSKQYNIQDSGVFNANETYEIEVEILNDNIKYDDTIETVERNIKNAIKLVLSGLQNTNYPIGVNEQTEVIKAYHMLLHEREKGYLLPRDFCGPASYTLELKNIQPDETGDSAVPNIRNDYTVTEKADGVRKLLFISENGKIYFIPTTASIEFTGAVTNDKKMFNSILDGEHIIHDKEGGFYNTYAAFDIYYIGGKSVREKSFVPLKPTDEPKQYRLPLLNNFIKEFTQNIVLVSGKPVSMKFQAKKFYLGNDEVSIFAGCRTILQKEKDGLFPYETDGLIFTPASFGVGGNKEGEASRPVKTTWLHSFKWKPAEFNTIDFLVSVHKDKSGLERIGNIFKNGTDTATNDQIIQFKILTLRCGFDPAKHGFLNPCQDVLMDKFPKPEGIDDDEGYKPVPFYPTNPYDNKAHLCHLILKRDATGANSMMCENGEIIEDNAIVEFKYDITESEPEYRWKPLRVRYDKTAELKSGQKNYGNAYHVANGNWHSIHNPVTSDMLSTGINIPEETLDAIYYDRKLDRKFIRSLRHFHNIGVKKRLIESVSKRGNSLIDLAVGKAGDLSKWTNAHLGFVFGTDVSRDNIENKHDGACARYLKMRRENRAVPYCLFVNANSALNIRSGIAMFTEKGKEITQSVFGEIPKNDALGPAVVRQYGKASKGFDIASCQFALHYLFENNDTLQGFLRNVSECVKEGGYFIGTCYDGSKIFDALKGKARGESISVSERGDIKVWEIVKEYDSDRFAPDETSLGYAINVYQESINKYFREYLVNFDYLTRSMENYGFKPLTQSEARELNLPSGIGNFKQMYTQNFKMNADERKISFYNNYFVFKKVRSVDAEKVKLNASDESATEVKMNVDDTEKIREEPITVTKKIKRKKKKLVLKPE